MTYQEQIQILNLIARIMDGLRYPVKLSAAVLIAYAIKELIL